MSKALEEFLALREASVAGEHSTTGLHAPNAGAVQDPEVVGELGTRIPNLPNPPVDDVRSPELPCHPPTTVVDEQDLTAYFMNLLAAHPSAKPVKDRKGLAHYLARGITFRFADPTQVVWKSETPTRRCSAGDALWVARCPAGHLTDEVIESHQVVGWACQACQRVYDTAECRMVPRAPQKRQDLDSNGEGVAT